MFDKSDQLYRILFTQGLIIEKWNRNGWYIKISIKSYLLEYK